MRIAVIGAGVMGSGLAQVLAQAGHEVHCTDVAADVVEKARARVTTGRYGFERAVERGKLARADADAALARLRVSTAFEVAVGGAVLFSGEEVRFHTPIEARQRGIAAVYQDPKLFPHLTVAENIAMGAYPRTAIGSVNRRAMEANARRLLGHCSGRPCRARAFRALQSPDLDRGRLPGRSSSIKKVDTIDEVLGTRCPDRRSALAGEKIDGAILDVAGRVGIRHRDTRQRDVVLGMQPYGLESANGTLHVDLLLPLAQIDVARGHQHPTVGL